MPVAALSVKTFSPACLETGCLNQVVGLTNNDGAVQFASCVAQFGSPIVSTVTPTETVFTTATSTVEYIDIIVSLTTETSTLEETVTSYDNVVETATEYTTTHVSTISTRVTAVPTVYKKRKRGNCIRKPSNTLSATTETTAEASETSTSTTEAPEISTTETEAITSTPAAPVCSNEAEYSSACSCIGAVGDITETVTATANVSTSVIYETVSSAIPSVSESVVNVVVTTVVVKPATVTSTATYSTALYTTTTTTQVLQPTQTSQIIFGSGARAGRPLVVVSQYVQWASTGAGTEIAYILRGGQPYVASSPAVRLYLHSANSVVGVLYFETSAQAAAYGDPAVSCRLNDNDNIVCQTTTGHTKTIQCGAYVYLAAPGFTQSGCNEVTLVPARLS